MVEVVKERRTVRWKVFKMENAIKKNIKKGEEIYEIQEKY